MVENDPIIPLLNSPAQTATFTERSGSTRYTKGFSVSNIHLYCLFILLSKWKFALYAVDINFILNNHLKYLTCEDFFLSQSCICNHLPLLYFIAKQLQAFSHYSARCSSWKSHFSSCSSYGFQRITFNNSFDYFY